MIELYEADPNNQAITKYTSDVAKNDIIEIESAITALEAVEAGRTDNQQLKLEILPLLQQAIGEINGGKFYDAMSPLELAVAKLSSN
jgi:hypothetical protein